MSQKESSPPWAPVCIKLLQGPLYRANAKDIYWDLLISHESHIQSYFATLGVSVLVDKSDGYAFLSQIDDEQIDSNSLPKLIRRIPLTPEISLLCVLLREALDSFDSAQSDSSVLVMTAHEIKDLLALYIKEQSDQTKFITKLDSYLTQLVGFTFLKELTPENGGVISGLERIFEVRRIIRAKIDAEFLEEFKRKLSEEAEKIETEQEEV